MKWKMFRNERQSSVTPSSKLHAEANQTEYANIEVQTSSRRHDRSVYNFAGDQWQGYH